MPSQKSPKARLQHILENIDGITAVFDSRTQSDIGEDYLFQRALERSVEIISETAKALPPDLRDREPDVPWKNIIGIGNLLRHEYYRIDDETMLAILDQHLPRLRPAVVRLLDALEDDR